MAGRRKTQHGADGRIVPQHGGCGTPEYEAWKSMRKRCLFPWNHNYPNYGGRGIVICKEWEEFSVFLGDMGPKPHPTDTLERIDSNGNYEPGNCCWASPLRQRRNQRRNIFVEYQGERLTLAEVSARMGVSRGTLKSRMDHGWPLELVLSKPIRPKRKPEHASQS